MPQFLPSSPVLSCGLYLCRSPAVWSRSSHKPESFKRQCPGQTCSTFRIETTYSSPAEDSPPRHLYSAATRRLSTLGVRTSLQITSRLCGSNRSQAACSMHPREGMEEIVSRSSKRTSGSLLLMQIQQFFK